jgi:hypothetical protein
MNESKSCVARGPQNLANAAFCEKCGWAIEPASERSAPLEEPPTPPTVVPSPRLRQKPPRHQFNKDRATLLAKFFIAAVGLTLVMLVISSVIYLIVLDLQPPSNVELPLTLLVWFVVPAFVATALAGRTIAIDGVRLTALTGGIAAASMALVFTLLTGIAGTLISDASIAGEFVSFVASGVLGGAAGGYARQRKSRK